MNLFDVYFNCKKINEFMRYLYGFLGILGCVIWSVMFVNGYNGIYVI